MIVIWWPGVIVALAVWTIFGATHGAIWLSVDDPDIGEGNNLSVKEVKARRFYERVPGWVAALLGGPLIWGLLWSGAYDRWKRERNLCREIRDD